MTEERIIKHTQTTKKKSEVPVTLEWNNARMVRTHSIRALVKEMLNLSRTLDVVKINIIGKPSTGKTTLALTLAHLIHSISAVPFAVRIFTRDDLINFEATLKTLEPMNHVIVFDDVSFLSASVGKRQIDKIQKEFTEIRHLEGGRDIKVFTIFNFHYTMSLSKYLRDSEYFLYTSIGSSDIENTANVIGRKYLPKLNDFRRIYQSAYSSKDNKFSFILGNKGQKFTYTLYQPFAPLLAYNNDVARMVVFPQRSWIDPVCTICANASGTVKENMNLRDFHEKFSKRYGKHVIREALRIISYKSFGRSLYRPEVKRAIKTIDDHLSKELVDVDKLIEFYDLNTINSREKKIQKQAS